MRELLLSLLILFSLNIQGQNFSNNFKIGNYVEIINDSILFYFNCTGTVVDKKCAKFYRKGKIDSTHINVTGKFNDYYCGEDGYILNDKFVSSAGNIALTANMQNDYLQDKATYFFPNGKVKASGIYNNGNRTGIWTYYYKTGQIKRKINFINNHPTIIEYYKENGKQRVLNGNGKYQGEFYSHNRGCSPFTVKGKVKNGKMTGVWSLYTPFSHGSIGFETFKDGKFIKGGSGTYTYTDYQKIFVTGFCANENTHLDDNSLGCPGDAGIFYPTYKEKRLHEIFYPELADTIQKNSNNTLTNQWFIIGIKINKTNKITDVNVKSSINDNTVELRIKKIFKSMDYLTSAMIKKENIDFDLFFSILVIDKKVIIPTNYLYWNR